MTATATVETGMACSVKLLARDARTAIQALRALANPIAASAGEITLVEN